MSFDKFGNEIDTDPREPRRFERAPIFPHEPDYPEALELIGLIAAEFKSDPQSVQCFDKRIVERVIALADANLMVS